MAVTDILDALLQTDMMHGNRIVRVRICGVLADLMVKIDPEKFPEKIS